jgi:preprotein translocase subunit SecG
MSYLLGILLVLSSLFLILLVLIQQGRGGGLAGAFGGMGGQSAFGTKAGDIFTKITIGVAAVWILLCVATVKYATTQSSPFRGTGGNVDQATSADPTGTQERSTDATSPAGDTGPGDNRSSSTTPPEKNEEK